MTPLEGNTGDMALRITVRIDDDEIADYEVRRRQPGSTFTR